MCYIFVISVSRNTIKFVNIYFLILQGLILSQALKNIKNIEGKATQKEIVKLRSEVSKFCFDCAKKEKAFKNLGEGFH